MEEMGSEAMALDTVRIIAVLGALVGVLALTLLGVGTGWTVMCYKLKRKKSKENEVGSGTNESSAR